MTDNDYSLDSLDIEGLNAAKGIKFIFLNVRSLLPNINLLRAHFEHSNALLIGITESWLTPRIHDNLVAIDGFHLVRHDRKLPKRGGGLLLYINDAASFELLPPDMSHSDIHLEALSINVILPKQTNFLVTLVYLPPSADKVNALSKLKQINTLASRYKSIRILAGDFNMDLSGTNKRQKDKTLLLDFQRSVNLVQTIRKPTRITNNSSSLIDLIFVPPLS